MKNFIKNNYIIIIAFALPILLIVSVALFTYIPTFLVSTDYNFLYATCQKNDSNYYDRDCEKYIQNRFEVQNNRLTVDGISDVKNNNQLINIFEVSDGSYDVRFFLHNTEKDESREIPLERALEYKLSGLITSPDGYSVSYEYNRGADFIFFDGGSSRGYYLKKGNGEKKLNLINDRRGNFKFIGWILSKDH
ncbi:MAG: hypothetical protein U5L10_03065 [Candidatus Moranbacteria bacterium]|nr:hypothetical protein [Candidatus Moranbacteria bacterium]